MPSAWTGQSTVCRSAHTIQELWKWTLTPDATAPCFILDVLSMPEHGPKDEFYWLGSVPCRSVLFVAMVIGVQVHERRIIYTLDDGTAVIESTHAHAPTTLPYSKLVPVASIGDSVRLTGKIVRFHETRRISVSTIERCISGNADTKHVLHVIQLWNERYGLPGPFVVPETSLAFTFASEQEQPTRTTLSPLRNSSTSVVPKTPSPTKAQLLRTNPSTPILKTPQPNVMQSKHSNSSLTIPSIALSFRPPSALKLRHPTRLNAADLTDNTFRIYMKHYMDCIAENVSMKDVEEEEEDLSGLETPCPQTTADHKQIPLTRLVLDTQVSSPTRREHHPSNEMITSTPIVTFTLSYLRRIRELSVLARMVVIAEERRKLKQERVFAQKKPNLPSIKKDGCSTKSDAAKPEYDRAKRRLKVKQLFRWAVVELYREGSIVLCEENAQDVLYCSPPADCTAVWRIPLAAKHHSSIGENAIREEDDEDVSDAPPEEEAYVPLTPGYLANYVLRALKVLPGGNSGPSRHRTTSKHSATTEEIARYLRRCDGRWERVGEWDVKDALDWLKERDLATETKGGNWRICNEFGRVEQG